MASGESKPGGFTVTDRRAFGDGGEPRPEAVATAPAAAAPPTPPPASPPGEAAATAADTGTTGLPEVDFHTFVLSLGSSALLHLGELEHPDAGGPHKDLPLAKHTIDILAMLEEKTKGNLTTAEAKLISSLLYDLRLRYVEATKEP
jgi:hypothetical protein